MDMLKKRKEKINISKPKHLRKRLSETMKLQIEMKKGVRKKNYLKSTEYFLCNILKLKPEKLPLKLQRNKLFPENQRESMRGIYERKKTFENLKGEGLNLFRKIAKSIKSVMTFKKAVSMSTIKPLSSQSSTLGEVQNKPVATGNENEINSVSTANQPIKGILSKKSSFMVDKKPDENPENSSEPAPVIQRKFERKGSHKKSTKKSDKLFTFNDSETPKMTKANDIREVQQFIKELEELESKKNSIRNEIKYSLIEVQMEFELINKRQVEIDKLLEEFLLRDKKGKSTLFMKTEVDQIPENDN